MREKEREGERKEERERIAVVNRREMKYVLTQRIILNLNHDQTEGKE